MKKLKTLALIILLTISTLVTACGRIKEVNEAKNPEEATSKSDNNHKTPSNNETESPNHKVSSDNLDLPGGLDLPLDRSITLKIELESKEEIKWSSTNSDVVKVEQNGIITALTEGESIITARMGSAEDECRVTVINNSQTMAYIYDPGSLNEEGNHTPIEDTPENTPIRIPEDINEINSSDLDVLDYHYEFIINEPFDSMLTVPNMGISYLTHNHIKLSAIKTGSGMELFGEYKGTMEVETAIDEESFLQAMKELDIPADSMKSSFDHKKMDVNFNVVAFDLEALNKGKYAFTPAGTAPIVPLVPVNGMVISEAGTLVSGDIEIKGEDAQGHGSFSNQSGSIPFVIEIYVNGDVTLYLPRMAQMCDKFWVHGNLVKLPIVWLK